MKRSDRWEYVAGSRPHAVTAFEDPARNGMITLRFQVGRGSQRKRTLRALGFTVRGARGGIDRLNVSRAESAADEMNESLKAGRIATLQPVVIATPLTIAEGWARASDPDLGKWNKATQYRKDIQRAIDRAIDVWGAKMIWDSVDRGLLRKLWRRELARHRADGRPGVRGTELTLDLVLAVGAWLRDEQLVSPTAALRWKNMDAEFRADADPDGEYRPSQPRYSIDEYRKLFASSWVADERYGLAYNLGAELRLGKVVQAYRRHLNLDTSQLRILGRGKKRGGVVALTAQQMRDVKRVLESGYLAGLERALVAGEINDYPLFPGGNFAHDADGNLVSRAEYATRPPIHRTAIKVWHREAERLANIPHIKGRGPYGSRRAHVDAAKEARISREGLQASGLWADSQMPDTVYADQEMEYARDEAAEVRARIRGEPLVQTANELQESSGIVAATDTDAVSSISHKE